MSESNNVKFVEDNGKWLWKRYGENGSVIHRSALFNTEGEAREDFEVNSEKTASSTEDGAGERNIDPEGPQQAPEGATNGSEGDLNAGSAGSAENQGSEQTA